MKSENTLSETRHKDRQAVVSRFALAGATLGLLAGLYEAGLLYFVPRFPALLRPDISYAIWFVAPLTALLLFSAVGAALGIAANLGKSPGQWRPTILSAAGLGLAAGYVALVGGVLQSRIGEGVVPRYLLVPGISCLAVSISALFILRAFQKRAGSLLEVNHSRRSGLIAKAVVAAGAVCIGGLAFCAFLASVPRVSAAPDSFSPSHGPNIVLIVLDTVRADHLSSYGYHRLTTPNIDRLASQGITFENAFAPSSWTLPSLASIFTGLLPHQHGANWSVPLDSEPRTLAEIMAFHGYETAAFNANPAYGLRGWGIAQGFEVYGDESSSLRHNLAATLAGRTLLQPLYESTVHYNSFDRRDAREVNRDVLRWVQTRSSRPFFLFLNYFDAHYPYAAAPPFDQHFGKVSDVVLHRAASFEYRGHVPKPPAQERASLVTAYDNSLAFLDDQVGRLLQVLSQSPDWSNTFVIITSDHGEAFGEHGSYGHGVDLFHEVTRVPLIFFGPGIPAGRRIAALSRTRSLFATVLDLALERYTPVGRASLRRYWTPLFKPEGVDDLVLSELMTVVSVTTPEWHYLDYATGRTELFRWQTDPEEKVDLAEDPQYQATQRELHGLLVERLKNSLGPWHGSDYLLAVTRPGEDLIGRGPPTGKRDLFSRNGDRRVGASQAAFPPDKSPRPRRPLPSDQELINSLPYQ